MNKDQDSFTSILKKTFTINFKKFVSIERFFCLTGHLVLLKQKMGSQFLNFGLPGSAAPK